MTIADRAAEYVRHHWPIAAIGDIREDGTAELAGPVVASPADTAMAVWTDYPSFGIALYCASGFAILELPAELGAPLHHRVGGQCPTLHLPHQNHLWRFVVRPHDDLADPQLLGAHGRLRRENVFVPIPPVRSPRWWQRRGEWLVRPAETLWEPGDPGHLAINLKRLHTATSPPAARRAAAPAGFAPAGRPA